MDGIEPKVCTFDRLLRPDEIADHLSLSKPAVYRMISEGHIAGGMKIGKAVRVDPAAYWEWFERRKIAGMRSDDV